MSATSTPLPWAVSDSMPTHVFHDRQGMVDRAQPVAVFRHAGDANAMLEALDDAAELRAIRDAAKAYDDAMNAAERAPTGDDYNALFGIIMGDIAPAGASEVAASAGSLASVLILLERLTGTSHPKGLADMRAIIAHTQKTTAAMLAALHRVEVVCEDAVFDAEQAGEMDNAAGAREAWEMVKAAIAEAEGSANG